MEGCDNKGLWDPETEGSGAVMECCDLEMRVGDEEGSLDLETEGSVAKMEGDDLEM
jgi:hypothetical protein